MGNPLEELKNTLKALAAPEDCEVVMCSDGNAMRKIRGQVDQTEICYRGDLLRHGIEAGDEDSTNAATDPTRFVECPFANQICQAHVVYQRKVSPGQQDQAA